MAAYRDCSHGDGQGDAILNGITFLAGRDVDPLGSAKEWRNLYRNKINLRGLFSKVECELCLLDLFLSRRMKVRLHHDIRTAG